MREPCTRTSTASCPPPSAWRSRHISRRARRVERASPRSGPCASGRVHCSDRRGRLSARRRLSINCDARHSGRRGGCADRWRGRPRSRSRSGSGTTSGTPQAARHSRRCRNPRSSPKIARPRLRSRRRPSHVCNAAPRVAVRLRPLHLDAVVVTGRTENAVAAAPAPQNRSTATAWPIISRSDARSLLGTDPVGLPGLITRRIRRSPGTDGTVVVEQAVDSSTEIQIIQRPASTNALYDSAARGYFNRSAERERADRLARFVGRLRVEITGPLSVDSLNRLLEQVAPLP